MNILVDDGTEDDHDSHIMMWQLQDNYTDTTSDNDNDNNNDTAALLSLPSTSNSMSLSVTSQSSSSVSLGPTPGSGMALDSLSCSGSVPESDHSDTDTVHNDNDISSQDIATSAWSSEVESMLNDPPPCKFDSFQVSEDPSLSSWVVTTTTPAVASDRQQENLNAAHAPNASIYPVTEIDENVVSHSPSPFSYSDLEPAEDFTGHLAGESTK